MGWFFLLLVVGTFVLILGLGLLGDAYDGIDAFMGLVGILLGAAMIVGSIAGMADVDSKYDQETVRLCSEKDGIVSEDGHCFVDGKPVEFTPGVYQR